MAIDASPGQIPMPQVPPSSQTEARTSDACRYSKSDFIMQKRSELETYFCVLSRRIEKLRVIRKKTPNHN